MITTYNTVTAAVSSVAFMPVAVAVVAEHLVTIFIEIIVIFP